MSSKDLAQQQKTKKTQKIKKQKKRKGCFQWLSSHGSLEGKVEAQHMVNEQYDSVYAAMKGTQTRWLRNNRPELLKKMSGEDHEGRPNNRDKAIYTSRSP